MRLYDTAAGRVLDLEPRDPGRVAMYVCGPTVYGAPHIGHGRFVLVYDVLRRYLEFRGFDVYYVSNITDIDDKIINRAIAESRSWEDIARECEDQWWAALDALGVKRPTKAPRATEYIEQMIDLIADLISRDLAYETADGVYLSVEGIDDYGLLAHQDLDSLISSASSRIDASEDKRSSADFALWKKAKPGEPTWPAPFGEGRPGWHTECVAMSLELLGDDFDLHGGGMDLIFPHHENERAQAVGLERAFARRWVHNGLVQVGGEKMSKSLGNFMTLEELLERHDPRSYRLLVLRSHYRSPIEVNSETLLDATAALERIDACARRFAGVEATPDADADADALEARFVELMDEDLDTPRAVGALFEAIRRAHGLADAEGEARAAALARRALSLFAALGLEARVQGEAEDEEASRLVTARDAARGARDFAQADEIRAQLEALGWRVEDTPNGTRIHR
jgi:cysteinyl-tRNA synthetase